MEVFGVVTRRKYDSTPIEGWGKDLIICSKLSWLCCNSQRVLAAPNGIACLLELELVGTEEAGVDTKLVSPAHASSEKDTILS